MTDDPNAGDPTPDLPLVLCVETPQCPVSFQERVISIATEHDSAVLERRLPFDPRRGPRRLHQRFHELYAHLLSMDEGTATWGLAWEAVERELADGDRTKEAKAENPWFGRSGWESEPELPIIIGPRSGGGRGSSQEDAPVEKGYVLYNDLVSRSWYRPFRTVAGSLHVAIPTPHGLEIHDPAGKDGVRASFLDSIGYDLYTLRGAPIPGRDLLVAAKALLGRAASRAIPKERIVKLWLRVAPDGPYRSLLDLVDAERRCVAISPEGWTIERVGHPVFAPRQHMLPLPEPARSPEGSDWTRVNGLWRFVALPADPQEPGDDQRLLALTILIQFLLSPASPKTVGVLTGEDGIGKSSSTERLIAAIDPSSAPLVKPPEEDEQLNNLAINHAVFGLDNASVVTAELSDNLARLSTGVSILKRKLYSDNDEVVVFALPQIFINGITATPNAADLLRRCVFLFVVRPRAVIPKELLNPEWEAAHPEILGGLLDLAVLTLGVLRDHPPPLESSSMADYVRVGQAVAVAMGRSHEDFLAAWNVNVNRQGSAAAQNPWVVVLHDYFGRMTPTSPAVRADEIARWVNENERHVFPKGVTSQSAGTAVARSTTTLRRMGVSVGKRTLHGVTLYFRSENEDGLRQQSLEEAAPPTPPGSPTCPTHPTPDSGSADVNPTSESGVEQGWGSNEVHPQKGGAPFSPTPRSTPRSTPLSLAGDGSRGGAGGAVSSKSPESSVDSTLAGPPLREESFEKPPPGETSATWGMGETPRHDSRRLQSDNEREDGSGGDG